MTDIACDIFMLVPALDFVRPSIQCFQLGASCPTTQLHCQGGHESDQGTDLENKNVVSCPAMFCDLGDQKRAGGCLEVGRHGQDVAALMRSNFSGVSRGRDEEQVAA